jgi:hypothetical protein
MQAIHKPLPASITRTEHEDCDHYRGLASELIAHGIVRADQLPGLPGHGKTAVTFWQGRAMARGERAERDETFLNVCGTGPYLFVRVGIPAAVLAARAAARRAQEGLENNSKPMEYRDCWWGELITGKKEEMQAMGIGAGLAFPGEAGGPKRKLVTLDPRGLKTEISTSWDGRYSAHIRFPDRDKSDMMDERKPFAAGVLKCEGPHSDSYYGSARALVSAGLVELRHLPGQPGCMRKVSSTVFPDGSMPHGPCTATYSQGRLPGAKHIMRVSKLNYEVRVVLPVEVENARQEAAKLQRAEFDRRMEALPRPARLPIPAGLRVEASDGRSTTDKQREAAYAYAQRRLKHMPDSKDAFLRGYVRFMRECLDSAWTAAGNSFLPHGYEITEDSLLAIRMAFDAVTEAVMQAEVTFDEAKHRSIANGYRTEMARNDKAFQSKLFALSSPAPGLIAGEKA